MKKADLDRERLFKLVVPERLDKLRKVLEARTHAVTVVLENVHDPHNLSAVLRSCDATGVMDVHLLYHGHQTFPGISKESSASAGKWLHFHRHHNVAGCFSELRKQGKKIYTTHMSRDAISLYDLDLSGPVALVFGNEHEGVSDEAHETADGNFLIPQEGMVQSLNISVACAVTLFEVWRQQGLGGNRPRLAEEEVLNILESWVRRDVFGN